MNIYSSEFYDWQVEGSKQSAREIIPIVLNLLGPSSVLDIGCGIGTWLSVFSDHGVKDILGIDGEYVDRNRLLIDGHNYMPYDLTTPLFLNRQFDLVISLEVAEHIPKEKAKTFIDTLTRHGKTVLFSAAIPFQGGLNHINEQWPDYWAGLFDENGYKVIDCIRKKIWQNESVEWWYAQNTLLFMDSDLLSNNPAMAREEQLTARSLLSLVHPKQYLHRTTMLPSNLTLSQIAPLLPHLIKKALKQTLNIVASKSVNDDSL